MMHHFSVIQNCIYSWSSHDPSAHTLGMTLTLMVREQDRDASVMGMCDEQGDKV